MGRLKRHPKKDLNNPRHSTIPRALLFGQKETFPGSAEDEANHTQNAKLISPLPQGNLQKLFYKRFEDL